MDVVLDQFVGALEELSSEDNNGSSTVSDFTILDLGEFDENFGGGVGNLKLFENSCAIIGNCNITNIINEHFVQPYRAKRRFDNI